MSHLSKSSALVSWKRLTRGFAHEAYFNIKRRFDLWHVEKQNPILVFQMGKVGSSTVVRTLHQLNRTEPVLHLHTLSPEHLAHAKSRQRHSRDPFLSEHLIVSTILQKKWNHGAFPCRIITLTREPISHAISFVFEDLKKQAPHAYLPDGRLDTDAIKATLDDLLGATNGIADPTTWFDRELCDRFGIDVFSKSYDRERGFSIISNKQVSVLVIRMEDMNRALAAALGEFLEVEPTRISMSKANVGAHKWYADALEHVKKTYRLAPDTASKVLDSKYCKHFYADAAGQLRERWAYPVESDKAVVSGGNP